MYRPLLSVFTLALFLIPCASRATTTVSEIPLASWMMLAVNETDKQADAHLIKTKQGRVLLIDAGWAGGNLTLLLNRHGVKQIDLLVISHAHKDHYGGLEDLLKEHFPVTRLVFNVPNRAVCDGEKPWGCDWADFSRVREEAARRGIRVETTKAGDRLYEEPDVTLDTLVAYDGTDSPVGRTDVNDSSVIARLKVGPHRTLFTGDLNETLGKYLAEHLPDLHADLLKVPHHGTDGLAPDAFFDRVGATTAMIPAPLGLWKSARSDRPRTYFTKKHIPVFVSGEHGEVRIDFFSKRWNVHVAH